jgi:hypothetical protein
MINDDLACYPFVLCAASTPCICRKGRILAFLTMDGVFTIYGREGIQCV